MYENKQSTCIYLMWLCYTYILYVGITIPLITLMYRVRYHKYVCLVWCMCFGGRKETVSSYSNGIQSTIEEKYKSPSTLYILTAKRLPIWIFRNSCYITNWDQDEWDVWRVHSTEYTLNQFSLVRTQWETIIF